MKKLIFIVVMVFNVLIVYAQKYTYKTLHIYSLKYGMQEQENGLSNKATIEYSPKSVHLIINEPPLDYYCPISFVSSRGENRITYISDTKKMIFYNHFDGKYSVWILGAGDAMYILSNESDQDVQNFYNNNYKKLMDNYSK